MIRVLVTDGMEKSAIEDLKAKGLKLLKSFMNQKI